MLSYSLILILFCAFAFVVNAVLLWRVHHLMNALSEQLQLLRTDMGFSEHRIFRRIDEGSCRVRDELHALTQKLDRVQEQHDDISRDMERIMGFTGEDAE